MAKVGSYACDNDNRPGKILEMDVNINIKQHMNKIIKNFEALRGKAKDDSTEFWDAVVITTADEDQSKAYRYQIDKKVERKELLQNVPFYVIADPPGVKVGSGGSILYSLDQLYSKIGDDMFTMRILFICAGGKSQRLPSASVLGKLFLPLPLGEPLFHMLDLQIALYLPFLHQMKPGVLITSSDAIETYYLPNNSSTPGSLWSFHADGFTALGTSSTIEIGKHHGVYVLPNQLDANQHDVIRSTCICVLQKPSLDNMKETDAILEDGNVCTDSIFFFDHNVSKKFLEYMQNKSKITCEIDAYGDFLQPLGSRASMGYIQNTNNVVSTTSSLASTREELFHMLNGTPLHVVFLQQSKFYHLGTMTEYIENVTPYAGSCLFNELNLKSVAFSHIFNAENSPNENETSLKEFPVRNPGVTVMHSLIDSSTQIGQCTVVEYCHIEAPVAIGDHCIISNCKIVPHNTEKIVLPAQSCFHTASVRLDGEETFVTVAFGINDDLKKSVKFEQWKRDLKFMGVSLGNIERQDIFDNRSESCSLWNARIFPVADTMEASFLITYNMVNGFLGTKSTDGRSQTKYELSRYTSMEEIVRNKSVERMIAFQEDLWKEIMHRQSLNTN